jgi:hypothetical protein
MRNIAAGLLIALAACSSSRPSHQVDEQTAKSLLIDRNWIDRMPETKTDRLHVYRFVPTMGGGVFQDRTIFKGQFELFKFEATGSQIRFVLPETNQKVVSGYRIETVDGPAPFDLELTLDADPRGPAPHVYFGIRAETDTTGSALDATLTKLELK